MPLARLALAGLLLAGLIACDDAFNYNKDHSGVVDTNATSDRYHPAGFVSTDMHSMEAKMHEQTCTDCHGETLEGSGAALSCDSCHPAGWRTNCTFCHGGVDNTTGAPPEDLDDSTESRAFPPHTRHVEENTHAAFDCTTCHVKPTDVLSPGHLFDDTPGRADVDLSASLSPQGAWDGNGGCSNLYCHGDGQRVGSVDVDDAPLACDGCHPAVDSGRSAWDRMSGEHEDHLREGLRCHDCHSETTTDDRSILNPAQHVDGVADFVVPTGATLQRSGSSCTGSCHGERHENRRWD
ncbi:MAG: CxxxxCH/CxxCH domain-containing protein [Alphaproteobacteria bacterium]|nr:CxxxxCH/CxxCH domain-containing protein [Alphaproteobacteria bacterium]